MLCQLSYSHRRNFIIAIWRGGVGTSDLGFQPELDPAVPACKLHAQHDQRGSEQEQGDVSRFAQAGEFFWRNCGRHHVD